VSDSRHFFLAEQRSRIWLFLDFNRMFNSTIADASDADNSVAITDRRYRVNDIQTRNEREKEGSAFEWQRNSQSRKNTEHLTRNWTVRHSHTGLDYNNAQRLYYITYYINATYSNRVTISPVLAHLAFCVSSRTATYLPSAPTYKSIDLACRSKQSTNNRRGENSFYKVQRVFVPSGTILAEETRVIAGLAAESVASVPRDRSVISR